MLSEEKLEKIREKLEILDEDDFFTNELIKFGVDLHKELLKIQDGWANGIIEMKCPSFFRTYDDLKDFKVSYDTINGFSIVILYYRNQLSGVFMYKYDFSELGRVVLKYAKV